MKNTTENIFDILCWLDLILVHKVHSSYKCYLAILFVHIKTCENTWYICNMQIRTISEKFCGILSLKCVTNWRHINLFFGTQDHWNHQWRLKTLFRASSLVRLCFHLYLWLLFKHPDWLILVVLYMILSGMSLSIRILSKHIYFVYVLIMYDRIVYCC